ncbi:P-loop containing nucleoside triphosphate hydrolase protein [Neocallimastix lanati (nom. inval.)]|nr:P-loop containing nucleoside triphosphate hydrolase protein [Neocallimastix sp. JGI-2020a]
MFFKKKEYPVPETPKPSPYPKANFFSKITYSWENPIFSVGYKRPLEKNDLFLLPPKLKEDYNEERFYYHWDKEVAKKGEASVFKALVKVFGPKWIPAGIFKLLSDICNLVSPVVLELLLDHLDNKKERDEESYKGWIYIAIIFVLQILATLFINCYFKNTMEVGLSVRATVIGIIYRKTLKLSNKAKQTIGDGQIINLVSTDSARLQRLLGNLHYLWSGPFQLIVILVLLIRSLGVWSLIGFTIFLVVIPLQGYIMKLLAKLRKQTAILTDQRVKRTQEIIGSMRVIKFFGWESSFLSILKDLRKKELKRTKRSTILGAETSAIFNVIPFFSCALTFIAYSAAGHRLTAAKVFSSLAFFNMLRFPLAILPNTFSQLTDAIVAMKRLTNLLNAKELENLPEIDPYSEYAISIQDGQFNWESVKNVDNDKNKKNGNDKSKINENNKNIKSSENSSATLINYKTTNDITEAELNINVERKDNIEEDEKSVESFRLNDINIQIKRNSLTAIVGAVGSGKSSLINSIIGEMKREGGKITLGGTISYCSQQAWIQNATVRDNILFGKEYKEELYNKVIELCSLSHDLEIFPDGDMTEIGERGINLSGGQKQRINLARAVYFNSDIILMDDPLSAVDAHVSRALFDNCILGALADKTRVLVTHQLHVLPRVDYIIVMKGGRIEEQGEYDELMQKGGEFARLMHTYGGIDESEEDSTERSSDSEIENQKAEKSKDSTKTKKQIKKEDDKKKGKALMTKEERATGSVDIKVYKAYIKAAGGIICATTIILLVIIIQLAKLANDMWLVFWTEDKYDMSTMSYILIYLVWNIVQSLLTLFYSIFMAYTGIKAASRIHRDAISRVIMAPISFFDTTPLGRIINRFSKDQDSLDGMLFVSMQMFFTSLGTTISTLCLMLYAAPIFGVALVPLLILYYFVQQFYRSTSRELKRIDSITRSPLYANFSETMQGLPTIRAYNEQKRFIEYNQFLIDENNRPQHLQITAQRWLGLRLESIGAFLVLFDGIAGLLLKNHLSASLLGLSLSYSLQVTSSLNGVVRQFSDTEVHMNSAERLLYYANDIETEDQKGLNAPKDWPQKGKIEIKNLTMKYAPHLPPVLHNINLDIESNEKIGVVGRTGAGKSSIVMTLFRLVEPEIGSSLKIDDIAITDLKLCDLRQRISIIPQDPILFSGTIRFNMDPFDEHTDQEIWEALENAGLKQTISELENKLEAEVRGNGENFSVGQRQLLCLARAMIRNSRILVMDEATASVDIETDAIIQKALRTKFNEVTVLTIAHRLNTIIDYDKILVLSKGEVLEYDTPKNLLFESNENGEVVPSSKTEFSKLVDETGPVNAALLRQLALDKENRIN